MTPSPMLMRLPAEAVEKLEEIILQQTLDKSLQEANNPPSSSSRDTGDPAKDKADNNQQKRPREPSDDDHGEPARKRGAFMEPLAIALNPEAAKSILPNGTEQYDSIIKALRDKAELFGDEENGENGGLSWHVRNVILSPDSITATLEDVFAPDAARILETATAPLQDRSATGYGILSRQPLPGILLYGPPGTGKTLLGEAFAKKSNAMLLPLSGAELRSGIRGSSEKIIKNVFAYARKHHPCFILLDNAHCFLADAKANASQDNQDVISQLLVEMTGINSKGRTDPVVIATTNQPYDFSESILGCFSTRVMVGLPDASSRRRILDIHLKGEEVCADFNLEQVVEATEEYSGRDIKNLVLHAAIAAHDDLKARGKSSSTKGLTRILRNDHITKAKSMIPLPTKRTMSRIMDFHAQFGGMRSAHGEIPEANEVWRQDAEA